MDSQQEHRACGSCGFLSLRSLSVAAQTSPREFFEVDVLLRGTPKRAMYIRPNEPSELQCYRGSSAFPVITLSYEGLRAAHDDQPILKLLDTPRDCSKWFQYVPGFSPKERLVELRFQNLEADRKTFQSALSKSG